MAEHAATGADGPKSDNRALIAFENAVIAKQCLHYAYNEMEYNGPKMTEEGAALLKKADRLLADNHRPLAARQYFEGKDQQDLELALIEAGAHAAALEDITPRTAQMLQDDILRAEVDQSNPTDDEETLTPEEEYNLGLVRMAAYLGDPPRGRDPRVRQTAEYKAVIEPLVNNANRIIFAHELKVKQIVGYHAIRCGADTWAMTDELYGTEGIEIETHDHGAGHHWYSHHYHHDGHNIFIAYMHNGVRYIQAATELFPKGFPRSRALEIVERIREYLKETDEEEPSDERPFWRILHDLHGAVSVGVHDVDPLFIQILHDELADIQAEKGVFERLLQTMALDNLHAARFLAGAVIPTSTITCTDQQVSAVAEAAAQAGMDANQVAYLVESLYRDPLTAGVLRPMTNHEVIEIINLNYKDIPEENQQYLFHQMTNQ